MKRSFHISQTVLICSFYALFFLVPLVLTPLNYELFEYNKMMLTYALTVIIAVSWVMKSIAARKFIFRRTPLDIPVALFFSSQFISVVFSINPHVSLWGYYSRFNGGFASTAAYLLLYFAFVSNFPRENIRKLFKITIVSGTLVSIYAVLEHFGIDKNIWVQDVQNRVFSTLGQPNWLAAYLNILILITIGLAINLKFKSNQAMEQWNNGTIFYWIVAIIFYTALIFTKSRSGFIAFWGVNIIFWGLLLWKYKKIIIKSLLIFNFLFLIFNFIFGSPFAQLNKFTLPELTKGSQPLNNETMKPSSFGSSVIDYGITESGEIRSIVWKGAVEIAKHYPLFGSGVETFAFSYYMFRPEEHNMTSEWDFLYNKAHNEYLNFAATTGFIGLGTYLLLIGWFILWNLKSIWYSVSSILYKKDKFIQDTRYKIQDTNILNISLFSSWLTILITNFFGFSVVIVQLFFYLIPAIIFVMTPSHSGDSERSVEESRIGTIRKLADSGQARMTVFQMILTFLVLGSGFWVLFILGKTWYADIVFANGYRASQAAEYPAAYKSLWQAVILNPAEPFYYDELALTSSQLAAIVHQDGDATLSAQLSNEAQMASDIAIRTSPNNVNFWKTRTRVFYNLSQIDDSHLASALFALEKSKSLSPTDPKIRYNLALIYNALGKKEESIKEMEEAARLKQNYKDAYLALAIFYEQDKNFDKAKKLLNHILTRIDPNDEEAKKKLEELK